MPSTASRPEKTVIRRFLGESSILRQYVWEFRRPIGLGLLALIFVDVLEIFPPILLKEAVDVITERKPLETVAWIAGSYLCVAVLQALCRFAWRMFLVKSSFLAARDLRDRFGAHIFGLSASFFDRKRVGDLMSLATNDIEAIQAALGNGLLIFADSMFYFMTIPVVMILLSPKLALLALLPLPFIPVWVARNQREIHRRFEKVQETYGGISSLAQEGLTGIRVIKAFAKEDAQLGRLRRLGEDHLRYNLQLARVQSTFAPGLDLMMSMSLVLLLALGGKSLISGSGAITLGTFVAFHRYIQKMVWPMTALGLSISFYRRAVTSSARLKEVLSARTDVGEPAQPQLPHQATPGGVWKTEGLVELKNLVFGFPGNGKDVIRGVSLTIRPGERIALIGSIGSGKSALLSLIPRLYPVNDGMILVDGIDINRWSLEELRRQIGYVGQDVYLFSDTVAENVAFGFEFEAVMQATRIAAVHEDVSGLVGSYDAQLGERGVNLSGGQKQRLTIARALVRQPSILILDDALSSVDLRTEERILSELRKRPGRNTELIAAHRISTIRDADRIVVLQEGEISQIGAHSVLIRERAGLYWRFYERQRLEEDLEQYSERLEVPDGWA